MERNEQWNQEIEKRRAAFNVGYSDEYMTRDIYDWNSKFMDEYRRLCKWASADGKFKYTEEYIYKELGLGDVNLVADGWLFINNIRRQMRAYKLKWFKSLYEAGKTVEEIAAEMKMTTNWVDMMIEKYCD